MRRFDEFDRGIEIIGGPTGEICRDTLDANEQHFLEATARVTFWANRAQYPEAREAAERVLMARLYGGILQLLSEARLAIINGDRMRANAVIDEMQRVIEVGSQS